MRKPSALAPALVALAGLSLAGPLTAQQRIPEQVADRFYRSIQMLRWDVTAETLHPTALATVHERITAVIELDTRGIVLDEFFGQTDIETFRSWSHREAFERLMDGVEQRVRGLVDVLATNEYRVVGHVTDSPSRAYVVVETRPYASGPVPTRMQVVTLERSQGEWKIVEAVELEAIRTAVIAVPSG